jgi:hypothetical protein
MSTLANRTTASQAQFPQKQIIRVRVLSPRRPEVVTKLLMRTFFARAYKAWVVYEGERLPMYWWESSSTGHSHPWVNMPATELLARPSTEIVRGASNPENA